MDAWYGKRVYLVVDRCNCCAPPCAERVTAELYGNGLAVHESLQAERAARIPRGRVGLDKSFLCRSSRAVPVARTAVTPSE